MVELPAARSLMFAALHVDPNFKNMELQRFYLDQRRAPATATQPEPV